MSLCAAGSSARCWPFALCLTALSLLPVPQPPPFSPSPPLPAMRSAARRLLAAAPSSGPASSGPSAGQPAQSGGAWESLKKKFKSRFMIGSRTTQRDRASAVQRRFAALLLCSLVAHSWALFSLCVSSVPLLLPSLPRRRHSRALHSSSHRLPAQSSLRLRSGRDGLSSPLAGIAARAEHPARLPGD